MLDKEKTMLGNLGIDWKNPPRLSDLKDDLKEATPTYEMQRAKVEKWLDLLNPSAIENGDNTRSKIQPKLIRKQVEWRYPALEEPFLSNEDLFKINPITHKDYYVAKQNEAILNKQFRTDINKVKFINSYIRTAVTTGTVIVKLSWEKETANIRSLVEKEVMSNDPADIEAYLIPLLETGQIDQMQAQQFIASGEAVPVIKEVIEKRNRTIKDAPVLEVKDPRNCYIDPSCNGDIDKANFIIDKFYTDIASLKKDKRYHNLDLIEIETKNSQDNLVENKDTITGTINFKDRARKKLEVYEYWGYWDIEGDDTLVPIRVSWVDDVIIRMERNPYPDKKLPYVIVQYLQNINSIYGDPDAALLEENQHIIGALTRGIVDLMARSANAQRAYRKDALDKVNEQRFKSGEDFAMNPTGNPNDIFYMFTYPEIPSSVFNLIDYINNETEALSGIKAFNTGISGNALGVTAQGIRSALDATSKRETSILRRLSKGLEDIAKKIVSMNSVFLSDETILTITDDEEVLIKRDDLANSFDLQIEIATAETENEKAQELAFMMQTLGNNTDFSFTQLILSEIAELRKMPLLAKKILEYQPQPDPVKQKLDELSVAEAEARVALLQAQAYNEQSKGKENEQDIRLKAARVEQIQASTNKTISETDKIDLDTLDKASGLEHDRELEKEKFKKDLKGINDNDDNIDPLGIFNGDEVNGL